MKMIAAVMYDQGLPQPYADGPGRHRGRGPTDPSKTVNYAHAPMVSDDVTFGTLNQGFDHLAAGEAVRQTLRLHAA